MKEENLAAKLCLLLPEKAHSGKCLRFYVPQMFINGRKIVRNTCSINSFHLVAPICKESIYLDNLI